MRESEYAEKTTSKGTQKRYISRTCVRPVQPTAMIFGTPRDLADVINRGKFCIDWFENSGLERVKVGDLP